MTHRRGKAFVVLDGHAYALTASGDGLLVADMNAAGDPDSEGWFPPERGGLTDEANGGLNKIQAALALIPDTDPTP